jgi:hypothetical protein
MTKKMPRKIGRKRELRKSTTNATGYCPPKS